MKSSRLKKISLLTPLLMLLVWGVLSGQSSEVVLDAEFFKEFSRKQLIQRDEYLESLIKKVVIGRGIIKDISPKQRYKKAFRVIIESSDSGAFNNNFVYYLYLENRNTVDLLTVDSKFEFKGVLNGYTALNTKRTDYILEVLLMDGSTVIE